MKQKILFFYHKAKLFFRDNDMVVYASSLSFYTIFSIIPILFLTLSIVTKIPGFAAEYTQLKMMIFSNIMPTNHEILGHYLDEFLLNSFSLGVMGFISIFYASVMFFYNYDVIIRKIFDSPTRPFWGALTTYWSFITLMPIAMILSIYLSSAIQGLLDSYDATDWINLLIIFPFLLVWGGFFAIFKISPFMNINDKAVAISSFATSFVWWSAKGIFVYYVVANKAYASIYGSFSALLFFFLWIYFSWLFFLYGLKLCSELNTYYSQHKK